MVQHPEKHLLVIGRGQQLFREYMMRGLAELYPIWLVCEEPPTWDARYVKGFTVVDMSDRTDPSTLLDAIRELAGRIPLGGVVSAEEELIVLTAHVTERFGFRGMSPDTALRCRDKKRTRAAMDEFDIPGPRSVSVTSEAEALDAVREIGLPVVVKPRALGGALGIRKVDDLQDVAPAFTAAKAAARWAPGVQQYPDGVLVETYLDGPNISAEHIVFDGVVHTMVIARVANVHPPYFEESDHVIDAFDPLFGDPEFLSMVDDVHKALGIRDGATLTQWRLTAEGPRLIEVNGRLGGDLLPCLGGPANGVDMVHAMADAAMGVAPRTDRTPSSAAIITFLIAPQDTVVDSVELTGPLPPGTGVEVLAGRGTELLLPPRGFKARYAYVVAEAPDVDTCQRLIAEASARVSLRGTRPAHT